MIETSRAISRTFSIFAIAILAVVFVAEAGDKALTFEELMKFRQIQDAVISDDGNWVAYALVPDRGNGEAVIRSTGSETEYRVERGSGPVISSDGQWVAAAITPTLEEREKAKDKKKDEKPKKGLSLVNLETGEEERIEEVESFAFSEDGQWIAFKHFAVKEETKEKAAEDEETTEAAGEGEAEEEKKEDKQKLGTTLELRKLGGGEERVIENVASFSFAELGSYLAYSVSAPAGEGNGAFLVDLRKPQPATTTLHEAVMGSYTHLTWAREADHLAFAAAVFDDEGEAGDGEIWAWGGDGGATAVVTLEDAPEGFTVPSANEIQWSKDGTRLFFGFKHAVESFEADDSSGTDADAEEPAFEPYDFDSILEGRGVDVWHWNDPRIIPNQKERWKENEKDRVYRAVFHLDGGAVVPLATLEIPTVFPTDNPSYALAGSDLPYLRRITWDGVYGDAYVVNLENGQADLVVKELAVGRRSGASLSPNGRFVLYYDDGDWFLWDVQSKVADNLTTGLDVPFANEDHDYPADPPGYGTSEWSADSSSIFIYDKYDIWQFFTDDRPARLLTAGQGRESEVIFRILDLDPEEDTIPAGADLMLSAYDDMEKHDAFYMASPARGSMRPLYGTGQHKLGFRAKAEHADRIVFTRERYDEFPDLWVSNQELQSPTKLSDANPQIADYAWGSAELVEWTSADGIPLQGVLIKPGNYEEGKRYPVLTYYYRFFSQRLHEFNQPVVNHRPSFPIYASNGYAVFLPDIRFEVGLPGPAATKCLVPGMQKLVDMGIADPDALGLHGHSWSGYQTAFVITQTDIFAAAVAGAPVSNMTSAYSGIRWGTGLARQFQYEKSQSRIGGSLWEKPELYIENSPVFYADRINTPLLIQHGDADEAVPWYQAIELYLACRRLDKNCIFLQYRDEPHHLKIYANKLDYSIKMKEFFDHYLKGEPAPEWIEKGVPYTGK